MMKERDLSIDILRCIGLFLIILAHVRPPGVIAQLRNFDVPMMVFVSGLSFALSSGGKGFLEYIHARIKRLVFPVWIFVTFFYLVVHFFFPVFFEKYNTISSYLNTILFIDSTDGLSDSLGYTWIIRIFLLIAIVAPMLKVITFKLSQWSVLSFAMILLVMNQFVYVHESVSWPGWVANVLNNYLLPVLSYGAVFMLGVNHHKFSRITKVLIAFLSFIAFVTFLFLYKSEFNTVVSTQEYKYPPSGYYLSYAFFMIFSLGLFVNKVAVVANGMIKDFIVFVSSNSIWIYLWHIPVVEFFISSHVQYSFLVKYFIACLISIIIMYIQTSMISRLRSRLSPPVFKHVRDVFTG
ncbi:acyltransferase family protein [Pantoea phytobeneficialis]|uniref:Acyltransferase n=1 Tax=Pantoea phytobeneficialis TaxID=2052056 RepID=A0AAP9KRS5_9GAMM|nr:acyltransferase [Pantoea phytobeneficialis]MDO6407394.1 acyltransferase [Pantoea phytobeneficialis]QGR09416.1 hypothetical protein CTZ24_23350 [Pantoea phytobeneficialis]